MGMSLFKYLHREDAILSFVLGFAGAWAFYGALETLYSFREVTQVSTEENQPGVIGQHTEDAISVETLGELYNSPNLDIKQASQKILAERIVRGPNLELLLHNAASKNTQVRQEAFAILAFLVGQSSGKIVLRHPKIHGIVVDVLVAYLPDSAKRLHEPHTDWRLRSKTERHALWVLQNILLHESQGAMEQWLDAGLVSRWLAHYPFGGREAKELKAPAFYKKKEYIVTALLSGKTDDTDLQVVLQELSGYKEACVELRRYEVLAHLWMGQDPWRTPTTTTTAPATTGNPSLPGLARRAGSTEHHETDDQTEAARRRRRREAVVIGDGDQPLSEENIFNVDSEPIEYEGFARVT